MSSTNARPTRDELPSYVPNTEVQNTLDRTKATCINTVLADIRRKGSARYQCEKKERIITLTKEQDSRQNNKKLSAKDITNRASDYASHKRKREEASLLEQRIEECHSDCQLLADEWLRCQKILRQQQSQASRVATPLHESQSSSLPPPPVSSPRDGQQLPERNDFPPILPALIDHNQIVAPNDSDVGVSLSHPVPVSSPSAIPPQTGDFDWLQPDSKSTPDTQSAATPISVFEKDAHLPLSLYRQLSPQEKLSLFDDVQYDIYPPEA